MTMGLLRRACAEGIGTYALVTAGCGAIMVNTLTGALTHVGVALVFGLVITVMIAAMGHISGAHFNPAVTVAFALCRHFRWREVPLYLAHPASHRLAVVVLVTIWMMERARLWESFLSYMSQLHVWSYNYYY